jgi:hypothetical protein
MSYYDISGYDGALFVHGNRVENKHYIMVEKDGNTEAWEKHPAPESMLRNRVKHIYTIDHTNKIISFGPDFEQVYVWCISGRFPSRPALFKIEPSETKRN